MHDRDQQLRAMIRQLFEAQSQLDSVKRSVAYKLACRTRSLFEFFVPRGGRMNGVHRAIRWAAGVWLDEGLRMLCSRAMFKLSRAVRIRFGIGADGIASASSSWLPSGMCQTFPRLNCRSAITGDAAPITRLNLVYHVTPIIHPDNVWQWNVGELLKRIDVFNGRRIITVATPTGTDAPRHGSPRGGNRSVCRSRRRVPICSERSKTP